MKGETSGGRNFWRDEGSLGFDGAVLNFEVGSISTFGLFRLEKLLFVCVSYVWRSRFGYLKIYIIIYYINKCHFVFLRNV